MSSSIIDNENEDEIKRYSTTDKDEYQSTIIAVFEGDYVRFAKELKNGKMAEEKIISQVEFEKMVKRDGWIKQE